MNPTVTFTLAAGSSVTSNSGTITFDATHGQSPPASSDGTFNAGSQVDPSNGSGGNSITFSAAHNLSTGDVITYSTNGNPAIGGLTPTRAYSVIVTSSTQIQLGDSLDGVTVDTTFDVLDFGTRNHNFQNGDSVYYFSGGSTIGGLTSGHALRRQRHRPAPDQARSIRVRRRRR